MSSISKACLELSNSIKGLRLSRSQSQSSDAANANNNTTGSSTVSSNYRTAATVTASISRALKSATNRVRSFDRNGHMTTVTNTPPPKRMPQPKLWEDDKFLQNFFYYFSPCERCVLAQVCHQWKDLLYQPQYWTGITPILNYKEWAKDSDGLKKFFVSLQLRGFDSICLFGATDNDINEFVTDFPSGRKSMRSLSLRCSNVTDAGLENLLEKMICVYRLELSGCNELTEAGLWSSLNSKIVSLSISDCINVADDSVGAIAQLLPSLYELNLQAYHVTDAALSFFRYVNTSFILSVCLSSFLSVCMSVCLSVCLCLLLFALYPTLSMSLSLCLCSSLCLCVSLFLSLFMSLSLCLSLSVPLCPSLSLSLSLSLCFFCGFRSRGCK